MAVQMILRDGKPEYAVLPYAEYLALLERAGVDPRSEGVADGQGAGVPAPGVKPVRDGRVERISAGEIAPLRHRAGISQAQLARRAGISLPQLIQIETGRRDPGSALLDKLAAILLEARA